MRGKNSGIDEITEWEGIRYWQPGSDKSDGGQKLGTGCAAQRKKLPKEPGDLQNAHKVVNLYKVVYTKYS